MRVVSQLLAMIAVLIDSRAAMACPGCPTSRLVRQIVCTQADARDRG